MSFYRDDAAISKSYNGPATLSYLRKQVSRTLKKSRPKAESTILIFKNRALPDIDLTGQLDIGILFNAMLDRIDQPGYIAARAPAARDNKISVLFAHHRTADCQSLQPRPIDQRTRSDTGRVLEYAARIANV